MKINFTQLLSEDIRSVVSIKNDHFIEVHPWSSWVLSLSQLPSDRCHVRRIPPGWFFDS